MNDAGTKIVYRTQDGSIYLVENMAGGWQQPIRIGNSTGNDPKISGSGNMICYKGTGVHCSEYKSGIWQQPVDVTNNGGACSINSDGTKLAFFRDPNFIYFSQNISGTWQNPLLVVMGSVVCCDSYPSINGDGTKIAVRNFFIEYKNGAWQAPVQIFSSGSAGNHPSINHDGTKSRCRWR